MWIEIFKTGRHTSSDGRTTDYSESGLDKIAERYNMLAQDDDCMRAPLIKGHSVSGSPALGWAERLARRGGKLLAKIKLTNDTILDEIDRGLFRKVSISLDENLMLRHIALLGAESPAVKGLSPVSEPVDGTFNDFTENIITFDDEPDQSLLEELAQQNKTLTDELVSLRKELRLRQFREYAESLTSPDRGSFIHPSSGGDIVDLLEALQSLDSDEISYTSMFKNLLGSVEHTSLTREYSAPIKVKQAITGDEGFDKVKTDPLRMELHNEALRILEQFPGISYEEAVMEAGK